MSEIEEKLQKLTDFRTFFVTSIISALTLVVGLFWNDAIRSTINELLPEGEGLFYKFLAAVVVTVIVVVLAYFLIHTQKTAEKALKDSAPKKKRKK